MAAPNTEQVSLDVVQQEIIPSPSPSAPAIKFKLKLGNQSPSMSSASAIPSQTEQPPLPSILPAISTPTSDAPAPEKKKRVYNRKKDPAKPGPGKNWRKGIKGAAKPVEYDADGNRIVKFEDSSAESVPKPKARGGRKTKATQEQGPAPDASSSKIVVPLLINTPRPRQWHKQTVPITNIYGKRMDLIMLKPDPNSPLMYFLTPEQWQARGLSELSTKGQGRKQSNRIQEILPDDEQPDDLDYEPPKGMTYAARSRLEDASILISASESLAAQPETAANNPSLLTSTTPSNQAFQAQNTSPSNLSALLSPALEVPPHLDSNGTPSQQTTPGIVQAEFDFN